MSGTSLIKIEIQNLPAGSNILFACNPHSKAANATIPVEMLGTIVLRDDNEAVPANIDATLSKVLQDHGFDGKIQDELTKRLKREIDQDLADLGRHLFFDKILSLSNDNSCAGCHAPQKGFGDTQSIARGIGNNEVVGPNRTGPRNQRRTPLVLNNAFYPKLMWNGRFASLTGDPFDNSKGFEFPPPEGDEGPEDRFFPAGDEHLYHLLVAQAQIPPTELPEMAGFRIEGRVSTFREPRFGGQKFQIQAFRLDDRPGTQPDVLPHPIGGFFNQPIRGAVLLRLNDNKEYKKRFAKVFPELAESKFISFEMVGRAIAEFEFTLTFATAPIDLFAQGQHDKMTLSQKKGALLFFGKARCVECHSVSGKSNQMFSDFEMHVIGVPQIAPKKPEFGGKTGNVPFAGPGNNEDFGLEDITKRETDRYKFRTSPLRNVALQPTFGHNGAWTRLADVIRHHLNPTHSARRYDPAAAGVAADLHTLGPIEPVLSRLSPRLSAPIKLSGDEFNDLVTFVCEGLLDPNAKPEKLCDLIPLSVPGGEPVHKFEGCEKAFEGCKQGR